MWKILAVVCLLALVFLAPFAFRSGGGVIGNELFASFCVLGTFAMVWEFTKQAFK